jgi:hypothetical protein
VIPLQRVSGKSSLSFGLPTALVNAANELVGAFHEFLERNALDGGGAEQNTMGAI